MKTIEINGVTFELTIPRKPIRPTLHRGYFGTETDIYDFYEKPSRYKVAIWEKWLKWARDTDNVACFNISSANCFMFAINGCYQAPTGEIYNLLITRDHNRAIKVNTL